MALLARTIIKGMLMTQLKIASAATLAALALASTGVLALAGRPADETQAAPSPAMKPAAPLAVDAPADDLVDVRGTVVGPDGRPAASATVRATLAMFDDDADGPTATTGPDGGFTLRLPRPAGESPRGFPPASPGWSRPARGLGVGWLDGSSWVGRPDGPVVRLPASGPAIEGRIVDLEGRPVADARVEPVRAWVDPTGDYPGWVAKARRGAVKSPDDGLDPVDVRRLGGDSARTDADGRFRLDGLGPDRTVALIVRREGIATTRCTSWPAGSEVRIKDPGVGMAGGRTSVLHATRFELAVAPGRRVEGTARDQDTGRPIAGLKLQAGVADDLYGAMIEGGEARTDDQGRYRLDGLPVAPGYRIRAAAGTGLPYTMASSRPGRAAPTRSGR